MSVSDVINLVTCALALCLFWTAKRPIVAWQKSLGKEDPGQPWRYQRPPIMLHAVMETENGVRVLADAPMLWSGHVDDDLPAFTFPLEAIPEHAMKGRVLMSLRHDGRELATALSEVDDWSKLHPKCSLLWRPGRLVLRDLDVSDDTEVRA